jgi:hypothetical protein
MKALYEAYHDKAVILVVYIREAHPANSKQTAEDAGWKAIGETVFHQPKTYAQRRKLAETACTFWELPIPTLVDTMDPSINSLYDAHPNRTYLIDTEGRIVYRGVKGPRGVNVHEAELELRKLLGITEGKPVTKPPEKRRTPSGRGRLGGRRASPKDEADESKDEPQGEADDSKDEPQDEADDSKDEPQGGADDSEVEPQKSER